MFSELLIEGIPHDQAGKEFKTFLQEKLSLNDFKIVHYQLTKREKVVVLRFRNPKKDQLTNKKLIYNEQEIKLVDYIRPILEAIKMVQTAYLQAGRAGKNSPKMKELASINLSNIPNEVTEENIYQKMSEFGHISKITIYEKGTKKGKKRLKCRLVTIDFENIQGAIAAFYMDKIDFLNVLVKIKFYLTPQKVKKWLKNHSDKGSKMTGSQEGTSCTNRYHHPGRMLNSTRKDQTLQKDCGQRGETVRRRLQDQRPRGQTLFLKKKRRRRRRRRSLKKGIIKLRKNFNIEKAEDSRERDNIRLNLQLTLQGQGQNNTRGVHFFSHYC